MVSPQLSEAVKEIYQEEASKASQLNISPLPKSRVYEQLLARGVAAHRQEQEEKSNEERDTAHKDCSAKNLDK